jgi:hypothetical protein
MELVMLKDSKELGDYLVASYHRRMHPFLGMLVAKQSPTKAPYYYTKMGGGLWHRWPEDRHFYYLPWLNMRHPRFINMAGLQVHSLAFGEIAAGWRTFQHWDCVNGFGYLVPDIIW